MLRHIAVCFALACVGLAPGAPPQPVAETKPQPDAPLRIAVISMTHDHVHGLLHAASTRSDIKIVGVFEPSRERFDQLAVRYKLDPSLRHDDLDKMLDAAKPEAASVMGSIKDHLAAVEACAPRGVHLLLEKPLAFKSDDARRMAELAQRHSVHVLTNYETSWYASVREAKRLVDSAERAPIRKMIFRHGHKGPKEIGCSKPFLDWLTDPEENGGGAITDFGCYGAILSTWLMNGARPTSVVASATTLKPSVYPRVDDDATIILTYPTATAVLQASWCWTHDNKEMDVHTERGSIHAGKWNDLTLRDPNAAPKAVQPPPKPAHLDNEWTYLRRVIRNECEVDPLSSLELNVIAVDILDRAIQSTKKQD